MQCKIPDLSTQPLQHSHYSTITALNSTFTPRRLITCNVSDLTFTTPALVHVGTPTLQIIAGQVYVLEMTQTWQVQFL